jgi:hypothetical protein
MLEIEIFDKLQQLNNGEHMNQQTVQSSRSKK